MLAPENHSWVITLNPILPCIYLAPKTTWILFVWNVRWPQNWVISPSFIASPTVTSSLNFSVHPGWLVSPSPTISQPTISGQWETKMINQTTKNSLYSSGIDINWNLMTYQVQSLDAWCGRHPSAPHFSNHGLGCAGCRLDLLWWRDGALWKTGRSSWFYGGLWGL